MAYLDTSAFLKLPLREPEHEALREELARWEGFVSSALLGVEAVRACRRYGPSYVAQARRGLDAVSLLPLDDRVLASAAELDPEPLRALDALHLATALSVAEDLGVMLAYDGRLIEAAREHGIAIAHPGR